MDCARPRLDDTCAALDRARRAGKRCPDRRRVARRVLASDGPVAPRGADPGRFAVTVVALIRANGDFGLDPAADTILRAGDIGRVFGLPAQIETFRQEARVGP